MREPKSWDWSFEDRSYWSVPSEEFIPTAIRWKNSGYATALDLGCGIGRHSLFLAKCGIRVTAIDLSETGIEAVRTEAANESLDIEAITGDMHSLPFSDDSFDCLVAFHSIYHTTLEGVEKVIGEIRRVVRNTGEIYITLNSKKSDAWQTGSARKVDSNTLLKDEAGVPDIPHTFLDYSEVCSILSEVKIDRMQQLIDYRDGCVHAHFFIRAIV